ncbi:MAG: O-antigen ligase family protein [Acidobacteria bacterium]|nr:O-antigen ligase family protein [Acidobacteriota bacterium]
MRVARRALRLPVGAMLAWWVLLAVLAPEVSRLAALAAVMIAAATLWRPAIGLAFTAGLVPAGALLAPAPARAPEMFACAFLAAWLLAVWRPIAPPRDARGSGVVLPALLYGAALAASWLMLTLSSASGVALAALPQFLFRAVAPDYLIFSSPEPQTWTLLQAATGLALLLAAMATSRADPRFARVLAWTLAASMGVLAAATLGDVARQWAAAGYGGWFLQRYVAGERFSLHLADLNAAGSLYVLGGAVAAGIAVFDRARRGPAVALLVLIGPALWLTGSRTSFAAAVAGLLILAVAQRRRPLSRPQMGAAVASLSILMLAGAATVDWQSGVRGSAARSASLRSQFMQTSVRMYGSAPVFGVGIGQYFDRSADFMPADLRATYGNENAHNYFVQQLAELGIGGGALFLWLAVSLVAAGWSAARASQDPVSLGLFAATSAYLATCLTGHPLLVPEAALPFWIASGALTAGGDGHPRWTRARALIAAATCVLLAAGLARAATTYVRAGAAPPDYGFHGRETASDGTTYRWMTRHAVTYVPGGAGFVRLRLRAPDMTMTRPLILETAIAGALVDRREIPPGRWVSYDIPGRAASTAPFRRVDLRANEWWMQEVPLGRRQARRPIAVMVAEVRWIPLADVR